MKLRLVVTEVSFRSVALMWELSPMLRRSAAKSYAEAHNGRVVALGCAGASWKQLMTLLEPIDLKRDEIARTGEIAIAEAKRAGVPAVYMDSSLGPGLIREMPDGSRERFERRHEKIHVLERFPPRAENADELCPSLQRAWQHQRFG